MMIVVHFTAGWWVGVGGDDVVVMVVKTDFVCCPRGTGTKRALLIADTVTVDKSLKD